jgi:hypothetical protein
LPFSLFKKSPEQKEREQLIKKKEQEAYYKGLEKGKTQQAYRKGLQKGRGGVGVLATMSNISKGIEAIVGDPSDVFEVGQPSKRKRKKKEQAMPSILEW